MTSKKVEKLHKECAKFGMDFGQYAWQLDEIKFIIRWAKAEKVDRKIVREKLEAKGCHSIEHLQTSNVNLDWL